MADEINDGTTVQENNSSSQTPKVEGKLNKESDQSVWREIAGSKFNSPEELAKSYKELEKTYGSQSEEVRQAREFIQAAAPVFEVIKNDPELFKALEAKLSKQNEPDNAPAKDSTKREDDTQGVREITSDLLIAKFEEKNGINKLEPEEAKQLRQRIGDAILELTGTTLKNVDLRRLGTTLENAYIIAKSKSAASSSETEDRASISSIPGSPGKAGTVLTPEEAKVAEKMGLTREQYLQGKKAAGKV